MNAWELWFPVIVFARFAGLITYVSPVAFFLDPYLWAEILLINVALWSIAVVLVGLNAVYLEHIKSEWSHD